MIGTRKEERMMRVREMTVVWFSEPHPNPLLEKERGYGKSPPL